jgi:geranylgeranyl pyrophosphate synthase
MADGEALDRAQFHTMVESTAQDWGIVARSLDSHRRALPERIIAHLENVGAIDACVTQAHELVESAWRELDPLIEDSQYKITFRAFGWYVLERHY